MSEKTIWISFDLGLKGDYQGLYSWLDRNGAKECGSSLAVLKYNSNKDIPNEIEREIKVHVNLSQGDRIYVVWKEDSSGKIKGRFVNGGRKRAPWQGYSPGDQSQIEDE